MNDRRVHYDATGGIATIEFDDPPAKAYGYRMMQQLNAAIFRAYTKKRKPEFNGA